MFTNRLPLSYENYHHQHHNVKRFTRSKPLCPMKISHEYSTDTFPFSFERKECKCKKCSFLPETQVHCAPLREERYFLRKGHCMNDGFYEWHPFEKNITVACACRSLL